MSVDALMDSDQMSREMIERVGPRVALQPCDDLKYRELAQEFLDFAEESDEPITVIRLTGADTLEIDFSHECHIDAGTQLAVYNSILSLHLAGEAEVSMDDFVKNVDWGNQTLSNSEKVEIAHATITELEAWVPRATFFADTLNGTLRLERDTVVIDSRFTDIAFERPRVVVGLTKLPRLAKAEETEDASQECNISLTQEPELTDLVLGTVEAQHIEVVVKEQIVAVEGIARQKRKQQPKFDLEVEGVKMTFTQDELAILLYAVGLQPSAKFRSSDVLNSQFWVQDGRTLEDMRPAFSYAASRLYAKLPSIFQQEGERISRRYHLTSIPEIKRHIHAGEADNVGLKLFMANFLKDFRQERPLGIDNFSLATLQKLIYGNFDTTLSLQPVKVSLMLEVSEDIATRLLNYDLLAVDETIIDRCYEMLGFVRKRRQAKELEDAIAENESNLASNLQRASIPSGGMKEDEEDFEWYDYGNCVGVDPDLFFPERGASTREAKGVCRGCEVRLDCLEHALQNGEKFGIWGGMSERERRRIRRQRSRAAKGIIGA